MPLSVSQRVPVTRPHVVLHGLPGDVAVRMAGAGEEAEALLVLSDEERERVARFGSADRRRSFALGRLAARTLLADALGGPAPQAPLGLAAAGAPQVAGHGLFVSIAHAGRGADVAAAAAVARRPVGVDLEAAVPRHPGLMDRLLAPAEWAVPQALAAAGAEAPALVWALKESVLKGLGTGLRRGAHSVIIEPHSTGLALAYDGTTAWSIRYERAGSFWLAVAWQGEG